MTDSFLYLEKIESNFLKSNIIKSIKAEDYYLEKLRESGIINEENINFITINDQYNFYNKDFENTIEETDTNLKILTNQDIFKIMTPINTFENLNKALTITSNMINPKNIIHNINNDNFSDIIEKTEKKKENILINKKIRLFNIIHPKDFIIFNKGGNDNYIRQLIKESLQNNKEYFFSKRAKKRKEKKERKDGKDNIRKKIKARFLKALKNRVNELLSLAGSKRIFNYLQQEFIININKEINIGVLDLTFKELYSKDFSKDKINNNSSLQKYNDNQSVLKYLEEEKEISEKSKYDIFKSMKYYQIFDEYLRSKEFESDIYKLKKTNNYKYIKNYIKMAFDLNDFFSY